MDWSDEVLHEAFKSAFLELPPILTVKVEIKRYKSTTKLSTKEFSEYLQKIDGASANWWVNISVPAPRGMWESLYMKIA